MREFVRCSEDEMFPYLVESRTDRFSNENVLQERFATEIDAMNCGRFRHELGYVVAVYRDVAFTIGERNE